jgi:hypothetical protein
MQLDSRPKSPIQNFFQLLQAFTAFARTLSLKPTQHPSFIMRFTTLTSATILPTFLRFSLALELIAYRGSHCNSDTVGRRNWTAETGCHQDAGGVANAVIIKPTEEADDDLYAVFFSGNDCNPDQIIAWDDGNGDNSCVKATYSSFEIWSMCDEGQSGCMNG